jgi:hypothetical protein
MRLVYSTFLNIPQFNGRLSDDALGIAHLTASHYKTTANNELKVVYKEALVNEFEAIRRKAAINPN